MQVARTQLEESVDERQEASLDVVLWTTDIPSLTAFLVEAGGLTLEARHPGFAILRCGASRLYLHADDDADRSHPWFSALTREGAARGIGAELRLPVSDVAAAYEEALALGAVGMYAPADLDGGQEAQVMGPDGFLFTFCEVGD